MRIGIFVTGICLCFSVTVAWAEVNDPGSEAFQQLLKKADRNGDGVLDNPERAAISKHVDELLKKELATKADKDGDGQLSVSERMQLREMLEKRRMSLMKNVPGAEKKPVAGNNAGSNNNAGANNNENASGNRIPNNFKPGNVPDNYRGVIGGLDGGRLPPNVRPGFSGRPENANPGNRPAGK